MKKLNSKDIRNIIFLILAFVCFVFIIANFNLYFGSDIDWFDQHTSFPDYFRSLFYKTKQLFPDYAFNIGAGQNIYNFSYYGLLSPIILLSYLFPFIKMVDYLIISTIIAVITSGILIYIWLRKKGYSENVSLLCSFMFLFSSPLSFHSHRHIMFVTYMPFLIMGLFGVDKKLTKNKGYLLTIATFLMIMTSYYYSIGGIISLVIYGIYKYIKINKKITFKKFMHDGIVFISPIIIGVLCAAIIILPTFSVILSGRGETYNTITLKDLLLPKVNIDFFLYGAYGIGLTSIVILSIINLLTKEKENKFLGVILALALIFPIFNYIMNATMYIDAKSLIPLLPLCIISIAILVDDVFKNEFNYRKVIPLFIIVTLLAYFTHYKYNLYLIDVFILLFMMLIYKIFNKQLLFIIPLMIIVYTLSISTSKADTLIDKKDTNTRYNNLKETVDYITSKDDSYYRINTNVSSDYNNKTFNNMKYYSNSVYSSIYNKNYNEFFYDIMNNNIQNRNRVMTTNTNNILFDMFMGNKYLVNETSSKKDLQGYELVKEMNGLSIYKNNKVLPIGYASSNLMSYNEFDKLSYPNTALALLNNIIVDEDINSNYITDLKRISFDESRIDAKNVLIRKEGENYIINSTGEGQMIYKLNEYEKNKILFVEFTLNESPSCSVGDIFIKINNNKNKLTCSGWKYHNQNYVFDYVIADDNLEELVIKFNKGTFDLKDIKLFAIDYAYVENIASKVDPLNITKMEGNVLEGNIEVSKDGYFTTTLPYADGFVAYVDGDEVEIEKVNTSFIGFKIEEGKHDIKIIYKAPFKRIGMIVSLLGILMFILVTYLESKQKI